jgi:L-lysine 6-transaminase
LQDKQDISANEVVDTVKKYTLITGPSIVLDVERSHDCYLYDSLSKTEYLDFFTFFATNPIGFNHPAMHEPKFLDRLAKAALVKPNLSRFYTVEIADWVETFARICGRGYFKHYFFVDGGALAVENALKTAFDWKVRKNIDKGLDPDLQMGSTVAPDIPSPSQTLQTRENINIIQNSTGLESLTRNASFLLQGKI